MKEEITEEDNTEAITIEENKETEEQMREDMIIKTDNSREDLTETIDKVILFLFFRKGRKS